MAGPEPSHVRVKVLYFGAIQALAEKRQEELSLPAGATVRDVVRAIMAANGPALTEELFWPDGVPLPTVTVLFEGQNVVYGRNLERVLTGGGTLQVIVMPPPLEGG